MATLLYWNTLNKYNDRVLMHTVNMSDWSCGWPVGEKTRGNEVFTPIVSITNNCLIQDYVTCQMFWGYFRLKDISSFEGTLLRRQMTRRWVWMAENYFRPRLSRQNSEFDKAGEDRDMNGHFR